MKVCVNKVIAGDYKDSEIQLVDEEDAKVILVIKKVFSKTELPMDRTTIKSFTHFLQDSSEHELIIEWNDGKISQVVVAETLYSELYIKIKGSIIN